MTSHRLPGVDIGVGASARTVVDGGLTPDEAAMREAWSKRFDMPLDTVNRNPDVVRKADTVRKMIELGATSPAMAERLSNPQFLNKVYDVPEEMSTFHKLITSPWKITQAIASGLPSLAAGFAGVEGMFAELQGKGRGTRYYNAARDMKAYAGEVADVDPNASTFEKWTASAFQSLGQNLPPMVAGFLIGGPAGSAVALGAMGLSSAGTSALKGHDAGLGAWRNAAFAGVDGAVEVATEMLPTIGLLKGLKAGSPLIPLFFKNQVQEQWTEQIATHLQDLNEWASIDANKGKTFGQYIEERPVAALQTMYTTLVAGGGQVVIGKALEKAAYDRGLTERKAMDADLAGTNLQNMVAAAEAGKVRARDSAAFGDFIQSVADESGAAPTAVWVNPQVLMQTLEQAGLTIDEVKQAMPSVAEQFDDAAVAGHDIRVPLGEFMANLPGTNVDAALIPFLRTEDANGELSMTQDEAKTFLQSDQAPKFLKEAERLVEEKLIDDAFTTSRKVVEDNLVKQLADTGRFTQDVNRAYGTIMSAFYSVQAHRLGITPEEMFKKYPINIAAKGVNRDNKMDQVERPEYADRLPGEDLKTYMKRAIDTMPTPAELPYAPDRFFAMNDGTQIVDIENIESSKSAEENTQGATNAPKRFLAAYHGVLKPRDAIAVQPLPDGRYRVLDGNGTFSAFKNYGWPSMPVNVFNSMEEFEAYEERRKKLEKLDFPARPAWLSPELYKAIGDELASQPLGKPPTIPDDVRAKMDALLKPMLEAAEVAKPVYDAMLNQLGSEIGALDVKLAPVKSIVRGSEKLWIKYRGDTTRMLDLVRGTLVVADKNAAYAALEALGQRIEITRVDDRFATPTEAGYMDIAVGLKMPNGVIAELQINIPEMIEAKEVGHKLYEIERGLAKDDARVPPLQEKQIALYGAALAQSETRAANLSSETGVPYANTSAESAYGSGPGLNAMQSPSGVLATGTPSTSNNLEPGGISGLFDIGTSSNILSQSVNIRSGKESLVRYGLQPGKKYNTRDVAMALEARQRAKYGTIALDDRTDESAKRIARWMAEEVQFAIEREGSGMGWYTTHFQAALDLFGDKYPELKTDQDARDMLTLIIAISSNGEDVVDNFRIADGVYANFRTNSTLAMQKGSGRGETEGALQVVQALYQKLGGAQQLKAYLLDTRKISELAAIAKANGVEFKTAYPVNMTLPLAAVVLGPKLGAFYANLMGQTEYLTMDRWWSRLFNRYRGYTLEKPTQAGLERFRALTNTQSSTDDQTLIDIVAPQEAYAKRGWKTALEVLVGRKEGKPKEQAQFQADGRMLAGGSFAEMYREHQVEKAANTLYKAAFSAVRDAPENASDREFMVRSVKYAVKSLKRRGVVITPADLQAVLWYYEKRLYRELGTRDSGTYSYEDAARTVLRESGIGQPQGQLALDLEQGAADSGTGSVQPYTDTAEQAPAFDGIDLPATDGPVPATADDFKPAGIEGILGKSKWSLLTAENPKGIQATPEENAAHMDELRATLKAQGIEFVEVKGRYGQDENSVLVLGIEGQQALELGKLFDQDSVLTRDGLIYQDGSVNPARKVTKFDTTPEDFYTTLPDGTKFQIDIDFDQRLALPKDDRRIGAVDVDAVHFSKTARNVLNGNAYGRGMQGAERAEVMAGDPRAKKRVHFYVPEGKGVQAEKDVGAVAHGARLTNLYDAESDPLKLWHSNTTNAAREAAVIDAGYSGYYARAVFGKQGTAVVFGDEPIMVEPLGDEKAANERLANSVPPPADYTPDKQLALRVVNNKGLPSGAMTIARWDAVIKAVDPELHARLEEKGAFDSESEEPLYRDDLVQTFYQSAATPEQVLAKYPRITGGFQDLKLRRSRESIQSSADSAFDKNRIVPGVVELPFSDVTLQGEPTISTSPKELARIEALTEEIKRNGVIEPLFVGMHTDGFMYLMEGQHRARALKALGYTTFPARIAVDTTPGGTEKYLFQGNEARGQITFADDITTKPTVITLLEKADLSTFLHEMGHFQLEVLAHMAQQPSAPAEIVSDMEALMKWFGIKDIATWQGMTLEEKRPHHEAYARGFEAYLFEGKSPNQELAGVFGRFRAWMINVYKSLQNLGVNLTPEVRSVFDRMLATNEQITQTEQARGMLPSIKTKPKGMSDEEWQSFLNSEQEATQSAVDKLQARSVRDLKWTVGARTRALKDLQAQAKEKRKQVGAEVAAEVNAMPIYAAQRFLRTGELPTAVNNAQRKILDTIAGMKLKLSLPVLKEMYGEGPAAPWRYLAQGTKNGLVAAEGVSPETIAELFGFSSGDHLVREILAAESPKSVIEGMTDQRMLERYGDLASMDAIEKAADEAVHNEARIRFVATELAMLEGATSITQPTGKTVKYTNQKTGKLVEYQARGNVFFTMARTYARQMIAQKKVRDLRPNTYLVAEARAGKEAFDTKGPEKQMALKRTQLINMQAYKAAIDAQREIDKTLRYLKKVGDSEAISRDYREQIQALLEQYDLRQVSLTELDRRKSLREWYDEQVAQNPDNPPIIPEELLNDARRVSYKDMSIEEFRGLADAVRNIEHLGKLKNTLLKAKAAREFGAAVDRITTSIKDNATQSIPENLERPKTFIEKAKRGAGKFFAMHVKLANTLREMDGWKDNGVMYQMFGWGMNQAATLEAKMREAATVKLIELFKRLDGKMTEKTYIPAIKNSLTREGRIMVAMNTGTAGNLQRLMDGDKWTAAQVQAIVDTLTKEEMDFVQATWDYIGTFRSEIGAQQKRLTGVEPTWIEATPVLTRHGAYRGGYLPAKYDTDRSTRSLSDAAMQGIMDLAHAARLRPKTRDSFTKKRAEKVANRPLLKEFSVVLQHVTEVTHRLAWQEYLYDASRLLNAAAVDNAIREHYGADTLMEMRAALKDIAEGEQGAQNAVEAGLNYVRTGATIAGLGWRVTTAMLQPFGLTQSMVRIGPKWVAKGMAQWLGDAAKMENTVANIYAKSDFMRLRGKTQQREISEIRNVVADKNSAITNSYFYLIQKMQVVADVPTWLGQYEKSIAGGMNEADAIAQADQAVLDAQGGGQIKDLAAVQRGGPLLKLFTNFYSFFNTTYNLTRESVGRTDFKSVSSVGGLAVDMLLLYTVPAVLGTLLKAALSDKDEDEEKLLRKMIADQLNYLFGTVVLAREVGAAVNMALGLPANYSGPAGVRIFGELANLGKQLGQGEADEALFKAAAGTAGVLFHLPSGQVASTLDGIHAMVTGKTENPGALLVGSSKQ